MRDKDRKIASLESLVQELRSEIRELRRVPRKYIVHSNEKVHTIVADEVYQGEGATFWLDGNEVAYFNIISSYMIDEP